MRTEVVRHNLGHVVDGPLFNHIIADDRNKICLELVSLYPGPPDTVVALEGRPADGIYIVAKGSVTRRSGRKAGTANIFEETSCFGEAEYLLEVPWEATYTTKSANCELCFLPTKVRSSTLQHTGHDNSSCRALPSQTANLMMLIS